MLTKELLYDMGIKPVGDVLSILAQANAEQATVTESDSEKVNYLKCNLHALAFLNFVWHICIVIKLHLIFKAILCLHTVCLHNIYVKSKKEINLFTSS